jgi:hypothetical protein
MRNRSVAVQPSGAGDGGRRPEFLLHRGRTGYFNSVYLPANSGFLSIASTLIAT